MTPDRIDAGALCSISTPRPASMRWSAKCRLTGCSVAQIDLAPDTIGEQAPERAPARAADIGQGSRLRPALTRTSQARRPRPDIAVMAAREAARSAASLAELREILSKFEGCALRTMAKQLVFADGNPQARVMFVGEAPGREEDLEGLPFVGRSANCSI